MTERARLIVCDDEAPVRDLLVEVLAGEGYAVTAAQNGAELRRLVPALRPDLVICDIRMPGEDGLSLTRWLRAESHAAVLLLTGMDGVTDRVVGLEMGADDYLTKPFATVELRARVRAILRRTMTPAMVQNGRPPARLKVGRCVVDLELRTMYDEQGVRVPLTSMEFDLLHALIVNARRVMTRDQLLELAHHRRRDPYDRSIDLRVVRLRRKIEVDPARPRVLKTVRGEGYMLIPEGE
jgi:two-component system phosphate regulon response regulator OmpR